MSRVVRMTAPLGRARNVDHVEVREIRMRPGVAAGRHRHNGPVVGSIVSGSVTYQIEGEPEQVLSAGDVFFEPADQPIARFDAGDEGAVFLGYFLLAPGQSAELEMLDDQPPA